MRLNNQATIPDSRISRSPSVIICLRDDFTGGQPLGKVRVHVKDKQTKMTKKNAGYYLFFNVPGNVFHLRIESSYYFNVDRDIEISPRAPGHPEEITLRPNPCYPFPSGTTLIRGVVKNQQGENLTGAVVTVEGQAAGTLTGRGGEFVFYITGLKEDDIVVKNGKRFLKEKNGNAIALVITHGSLTGRVEINETVEGEVTLIASPIVLK